jgi:hypothetical protein
MKAILRDTKRRLYCGPTAICAVTGLSASRVLALIDADRGAAAYKTDGRLRGVRGMHHLELLNALALLGFPARYIRVHDRPTLAAWLKDHRPTEPMIVNVTGHYVAVDARTFIDTKTKGLPVRLKDAPGRRARVRGFIEIINAEGK